MSVTIKILQSACNCSSENIKDDIETAAAQEGIEVSIEEISDLQETMKYGTTNFPSLVIDGKVLAYEKVGGSDELKKLLNKTRNNEL